MAKDPPYTYRGALKILGHGSDSLLDALDTVLGGFILGSVVTPVAWAFNLVDQKNEASGLIRKLVQAGIRRLGKAKGKERYELIDAAHTTIVVSAFFDVTRESGVKLSKDHLRSLGPAFDSALELQYWRGCLLSDAQLSFHYLNLGHLVGMDEEAISVLKDRATVRYRAYFADLAADVPEFSLWARLGGLAEIRDTGQAVLAAVNAQSWALNRLNEILLARGVERDDDLTPGAKLLAKSNQAVLAKPITPDGVGAVNQVTLPAVWRIYQAPRFRSVVTTGDVPANDYDWESLDVHDDLDRFLGSYLFSPRSVESPLLLLGHPGAGKSLFSKVLAARLPAKDFIVVRVELRRVNADARVPAQIQEALDLLVNDRVKWGDLVDEAPERTRVVILDGLDELLQASTAERKDYLEQVAEFQAAEADLGYPVVVVVTSRTVVADRVRVAPWTTVVKLEDFSEEQMLSWLEIWRGQNLPAITSGRMGELRPDVATELSDLTAQPLLLLMLALYSADPKAEPLEAGTSRDVFYERILTSFVRRELAKARPEVAQDAVDEEMWRLGVAAFAMFNRDRQSVRDHDLGSDIRVLTQTSSDLEPHRLGQRIIGRFFFIHTDEADGHRDEDVRRAYEFLHATFGEYLVAHHTIRVLREVARTRRSTPAGRRYDDDLIFALLSHQTLATRATTINFLTTLLRRLPAEERFDCARALVHLAGEYRDRRGGTGFAGYRPTPVDHLREMAAYSANLVLLLALAGDDVPFVDDAERIAMVRLWRAGLPAPGWRSLVEVIDFGSEGKPVKRLPALPGWATELAYYSMTDDKGGLDTHSNGLALQGLDAEELRRPKMTQVTGLLLSTVAHSIWGGEKPDLQFPLDLLRDARLEPGLSNWRGFDLYYAVVHFLQRWLGQLEYEAVQELVSLAHDANDLGLVDFDDFIPAIAAFPRLLVDVPALNDPSKYSRKWGPVVLLAGEEVQNEEGRTLLRSLRQGLAPDVKAAEPRYQAMAAIRWMSGISGNGAAE
ncbi:NACHT domain-containing protein [Amycolatopsis alba]|uniref:ATP-binding protein n=1 Tax=Amycolatopsis alba DSM 44262 TaxID=1125972 RepID=A0A229RVM1_AMYAL|nr:ATP-binding protein [Amycolatopsis alba]OXM50706.1 ATP-binding protein [Amycolatopsis alba DSM 44262]